VPPLAYGGVESVVAALADGFVAAGHDVTLFARGGSATRARVVAIVDELPAQPGRRIAVELDHALECLLSNDFDLVNNHMGLIGAALDGRARPPIVHTVSDPIDRTKVVWQKLARYTPALRLISISRRQQEVAPELPWVASIPNPIDLARFPFQPLPGPYLAFVGRMSPDKGCHHAIAVAQRAGVPLKIAAKLREEHEREYFEQRVRPCLTNDIEYLGELGHAEKVALLRDAFATLCPVVIEEAFGLVAAESMACGTPVVAYRKGAMPEIIADGRTGFIVEDEEEMHDVLARIESIDRSECRRHVEQNFAVERVVSEYQRCYDRVITTT
jgi:glycosyltransferase involved in cell wall biosynthesis